MLHVDVVVCAGCNDSESITAVHEQSDAVTLMDCTESDMLNDVVEIISNDIASEQVCMCTSLTSK